MVSYIGTHDFTGASPTGLQRQCFDAVVAASGGDYTTLQAAITAGATSIFIRDGTYAAVANITLPNYCHIVGESWNAIINLAGYTLNCGDYNTIENLKILTSSNVNVIVIKTNTHIDHVFIEDQRSTNPSAQIGMITDNNVAAIRCRLTNIQFDLTPLSSTDFSNKTAIWMQNAGSDNHFYANIEFGGATTSQCRQLYHAGQSLVVTNSTWQNNGTAAGATIVSITGGDTSVSNCTLNSLTNGVFTMTGVRSALDNLSVANATQQINIQGNGSTVNNITSLGKIAISANHVKMTGCVFEAGVTVAGSNNTLSATTAGAVAGGGTNTITISSGTTNCVTSCHTDAAISDSGTSTVLANNTVY
jgi:hypothetical protein